MTRSRSYDEDCPAMSPAMRGDHVHVATSRLCRAHVFVVRGETQEADVHGNVGKRRARRRVATEHHGREEVGVDAESTCTRHQGFGTGPESSARSSKRCTCSLHVCIVPAGHVYLSVLLSTRQLVR